MTWEIFLGIAALASFVILVGGPIIKLNTSITKLQACFDALENSINRLEVSIQKLDSSNAEGHRRLWDHNTQQDKLIDELTFKLTSLTEKVNHLTDEKYHEHS